MCGIAGIVSKDAQADLSQQIKAATNTLVHRGPEAEGYWLDENKALGHKRLCIIDADQRSSQPFEYLARYIIVHNGELYNYRELKKELQQQGLAFRTESDTEVIVAAYHAYKEKCLQQFDGMFAFAIWDKKEQILFAARDRFGEKPFFFFFDEKQLVFASEIKAIWAAGVEKQVNQRMLYNYLTIGYTANPFNPQETFYENIHKLPAASFFIFSAKDSSISIEKFWTVDIILDKDITEETAIHKFSSLLISSINKRLRSDVAIGTCLSGGLDSSSIVAIAAQASVPQYSHKCFTAIFEGYEKSEEKNASLIAKQFSLKQFFVPVTVDDLINNMDALMWHQEEPVGSASVLAQYKVYEAAKQNGVTVLLDGQGADELLAGYTKYYKWYWQELYAARSLRKSEEWHKAKALGINEQFGWKNKLLALFPHFAMALSENSKSKKAANRPDLGQAFVSENRSFFYYSTPVESTLNSALYFNTFIYGLEELLRYADRNSMAHAVEVRLPFLHHELAEFLFSLPPRYKIQNGWTKWLLREAMKEKLPAQVAWRKDKVGFEPPQKQWMSHKVVQEKIQEAKKILVDKGVLNASVLAKKIIPSDAHAANSYDWRYWSASYLFR